MVGAAEGGQHRLLHHVVARLPGHPAIQGAGGAGDAVDAIDGVEAVDQVGEVDVCEILWWRDHGFSSSLCGGMRSEMTSLSRVVPGGGRRQVTDQRTGRTRTPFVCRFSRLLDWFGCVEKCG